MLIEFDNMEAAKTFYESDENASQSHPSDGRQDSLDLTRSPNKHHRVLVFIWAWS